MTSVDMHFHWAPKGFADALRQRSVRPRIFRGDDGAEYFESGFNPNKLPADHDSADARIAEMDRNGVRARYCRTSCRTSWRCRCEDALPLCRAYNDSISAPACPSRPLFRLRGPAGRRYAMRRSAEFERAMACRAWSAPSCRATASCRPSAPRSFAPLLEAADRRGAILLVHYGRLPNDPEAPQPDLTDNRRLRIGTLDMQARISSNMLTFCLTDFLKPYPNLTMMSHNLGGNIPFEVERLDHRTMSRRPSDELPSKRIRERAVLVDCNSLGARSIERAVEVYGAEKIVFGSDGTISA